MAGVLTSAFSNLHRCCQCCQCCHCCQFHRWLSRLRWGFRRENYGNRSNGLSSNPLLEPGEFYICTARAQERPVNETSIRIQNDMELIIQWKKKPNFKSIPKAGLGLFEGETPYDAGVETSPRWARWWPARSNKAVASDTSNQAEIGPVESACNEGHIAWAI